MNQQIVKRESTIIISESAKIPRERISSDSIQVWGFLNQPKFKKNTKQAYVRAIKQFFKFHAQCGIKEITTPHVTLFLKSKFEGAKPATINQVRSALSAMFDHLLRSGYVDRNPVSPVGSVTIHPNVGKFSLSAESVQRMISSAERPRDEIILLLLYAGAARESEVIEIKVADFRIQNDNRAKLLLRGKGNKPREIWLSERVATKIQNYIKSQKLKSNEYVFFSPRDRTKHLTRMTVFNLVKAVGEKVKIFPAPHPHALRFAAAEHAKNAGANIREIQLTLGHQSLHTTQKYFESIEKRGISDFLELPESEDKVNKISKIKGT